MPIRYRCPQCRQLLSIGTRMAGQSSVCPSCGAVHEVRAPAPQAPPPPVANAAGRSETNEADAESSLDERDLSLPGEALAPPPLPHDPLAERARHWIDDVEDEGLVIQGFERKSDEL